MTQSVQERFGCEAENRPPGQKRLLARPLNRPLVWPLEQCPP